MPLMALVALPKQTGVGVDVLVRQASPPSHLSQTMHVLDRQLGVLGTVRTPRSPLDVRRTGFPLVASAALPKQMRAAINILIRKA